MRCLFVQIVFHNALLRSRFRQISGGQSRNNNQNPCEVSGRGAAAWVPAGWTAVWRASAMKLEKHIGLRGKTWLTTETSTDSPAVVPPPKATKPLTSCTVLFRLSCTDTVISSSLSLSLSLLSVSPQRKIPPPLPSLPRLPPFSPTFKKNVLLPKTLSDFVRKVLLNVTDYNLLQVLYVSVFTPVVCGICISQYGSRRKMKLIIINIIIIFLLFQMSDFFVHFIVFLYFCYEIIFYCI